MSAGQIYLRNRYYQPIVGRFSQRDIHWNTANMIYGDDPRFKEYDEYLGLNDYTVKLIDYAAVRQSGNLYTYCINSPIIFVDSNGEWVHILIGVVVGAVVGGVSSVVQQVTLEGKSIKNLDWGRVGINAAGGAVSGGLTAIGCGVIAATISAGSTNVVEQAYVNGWDFTNVDVGEVLTTAAISAIGTKVGGNTGNIKHLDTMGTNMINRISKVLTGKNFATRASLNSAGKEVFNALKYYASQTTKDNLKTMQSILKSYLPWLADLGYDVYSIEAGKQ